MQILANILANYTVRQHFLLMNPRNPNRIFIMIFLHEIMIKIIYSLTNIVRWSVSNALKVDAFEKAICLADIKVNLDFYYLI